MSLSQSTIESQDKVQTIEEIALENEAAANVVEKLVEEGTPSITGDETLYAGKFKTTGDLEDAYRALEQKFHSNERGNGAEDDATGVEKTGLSVTKDDAEALTEKAGLDFDDLTAKYAANGKLEDDDYEALAKVGIPSSTVETYIKGQEALAREYEGEVMKSVGGPETYGEISKWASDNMTENQLEVFNKAVNSGNVDEAKFAVESLKAKYEDSVGREPASRLSGQPATNGTVYESRDEWISDMQDGKYWKDAGYRSRIESKHSRSFSNA